MLNIFRNWPIFSERIKKLLNIYDKEKFGLRRNLESLASLPPHIVDIDWKLDYHLMVRAYRSICNICIIFLLFISITNY